MHSGGFELTKLTYTKLEEHLIMPPGRPAYIPFRVNRKVNLEEQTHGLGEEKTFKFRSFWVKMG